MNKRIRELMEQAMKLKDPYEVATVKESLTVEAKLNAIKEAEKQAPAVVVPDEVAQIMTTTDIAWLSTHRLTNLWFELGQVQWMGVDEGWNLAIEAVRKRLNDECQAVLDWKARADQSNETAIKLLQKMQRLERSE